jgi:hypothetical protein
MTKPLYPRALWATFGVLFATGCAEPGEATSDAKNEVSEVGTDIAAPPDALPIDARSDTGLDTTAQADTLVDTGGGAEVDASTPIEDADSDGVPDDVDNCAGLFNPTQADADSDGIGDLCDPTNDDADGDGLADGDDPFPNDPQRPGVVLSNSVYAHTSNELYYLGVKRLEIRRVGPFRFESGFEGQMTDIAIDRAGVLWGISFDNLYVIRPDTAEAWYVASLPRSFNGLTLVPRGVLGSNDDVLVGVSNDGGWWRLDFANVGGFPQVQISQLGSYGSDWGSSGDAFSIEGVGTFASVNSPQYIGDRLAKVDPATGAVLSIVTQFGNYGQVWGLAGWSDRVFGFDASGAITVLDISSGQITDSLTTDKSWWGAGVKTVLDQE